MPEANPPLTSWTPRQTIGATLVVAGVGLGFLLLYLLQSVLFLLFVGVVVATALKPIIALVERLNVSHGTAVSLVYMTLGALLLLAIVTGLPLVVDQLTAMVDQVPKYYETLRQELLKLPGDLVQRLVGQLPADIFAPSETAEADAPGLNSLTQALSYGEPVLQGTLAAVAVLLFAFYWSLQEVRSIRALLMLAPPSKRKQVREILESMQSKVGAYLRGQGILCLVVGVLNFLAFLLIGLPYAVTLGVVAGVCEAVPMFGPVLGALPAALVALSVDPSKVIWVGVAAVVIQQMENYLLVPRVMDRSVGVNPVVTLLAIAGFGSILGFAGAILAIPLAAILQVLLTRFLLSSEALEPPPVTGRDAASLIRYQTRELIHDVRLQMRRQTVDDDDETDLIQEEIEAIARDLDRSLPEPAQAATASTNGNPPVEAAQ